MSSTCLTQVSKNRVKNLERNDHFPRITFWNCHKTAAPQVTLSIATQYQQNSRKQEDMGMKDLTSPQKQWEELATSAQYNAKHLALLCGVSVRQLQRRSRKWLNLSPQHWLDQRRLIEAQQLLSAGQSVKQVALHLGFKQPSHFCRQFKRHHNMTPSQFVSLLHSMSLTDSKCR
jgi:AraC-like DNA-binding protein